MAQIIFEHVTKKYHDTVALNDVSFEIAKGEFVFVTGMSGAGKSTLLNLLLKQEEVTSGQIIAMGQRLDMMKSRQISAYRRRIGFVSPDLGLLNDRSVYSNIQLAMMATGKSDRREKKTIMRLLGQVGLMDKAEAYPQELSGGEQARILLVRALSVKPEILIADEPTANLDPDNAWDLMQLLNELNYQGMTVLVASHARELVTIMSKRCMTLVAGNLVADARNSIYNSRAMDIFAERAVREEQKRK